MGLIVLSIVVFASCSSCLVVIFSLLSINLEKLDIFCGEGWEFFSKKYLLLPGAWGITSRVSGSFLFLYHLGHVNLGSTGELVTFSLPLPSSIPMECSLYYLTLMMWSFLSLPRENPVFLMFPSPLRAVQVCLDRWLYLLFYLFLLYFRFWLGDLESWVFRI